MRHGPQGEVKFTNYLCTRKMQYRAGTAEGGAGEMRGRRVQSSSGTDGWGGRGDREGRVQASRGRHGGIYTIGGQRDVRPTCAGDGVWTELTGGQVAGRERLNEQSDRVLARSGAMHPHAIYGQQRARGRGAHHVE